mgnify:CR=1 FL=1|jgi:hypothetical protein
MKKGQRQNDWPKYKIFKDTALSFSYRRLLAGTMLRNIFLDGHVKANKK